MKYNPRKHGCKCDSCPRKTQTPVPPEGNPNGARYVWIGQDPGKQEAKQGRPFVGATGTRITHIWERACAAAGVKIDRKEIFITNAALCLPLENEKGKDTATAMACCRPRLMAELASVDPNAWVLAMGKWALAVLTGSATGISKLIGFHIKINQPTGQKEVRDDLRKDL